MKNIIKTISLCLIGILLLGTFQIKTVHAETKSNTIKDLEQLNDSDWNEFLNNIDTSVKPYTEEFYVKVYENDENDVESKVRTIEKRVFTYDEYIEEMNKPQARQHVTPAGWLRFNYEIYPVYIDTTKASVVVEYEWLTTPKYQMEDIFTISSDSSAVIPGSNSKVNVAYWPNKACPYVVVSYPSRKIDPQYPQYSYESSDFPKYQFDTNGVSFKQWLSGAGDIKLNNTIKQSRYANSDYFTANKYSIYTTNGKPKGSMGFLISRGGNTMSKLLFTYHHKQVTANFNPSISVSSSGSVGIGGFSGGLGYDKVSTSIDYTWGQVIE